MNRISDVPVRNLNIHEWSSMELLREHGLVTPRGYLATTPDETEELFREHFSAAGNGEEFREAVLKAQVLSGSRYSGTFENGFEGGVNVVSDPGHAKTVAENMLGHKLVTRQAPDGVVCQSVLLVEKLRLTRELYLSILMDRSSQGPLLIGSPLVGGGRQSSLVEVARARPDLVFVEEIDIEDGLEPDRCERMAENLGLDPGTRSFDQTVDCMMKLYEVFERRDCTLIEVNPLGEAVAMGGNNNNNNNNNNETTMVVVDAKLQFDDNAEFRQRDVFALRDYDQEDPREAEAIQNGIDYIGLDGNIGCMVNGAGLAMATMDLVVARGGSPSNFLDVGGGASGEQVKTALALLHNDPSVAVILVNIFGGLMRCDVIARGILDAADGAGIFSTTTDATDATATAAATTTPVVIRLQGTNYKEAEALIANSGLSNVFLAGDLDDAVGLAVKLAEEAERAATTTTAAAASAASAGTARGSDKKQDGAPSTSTSTTRRTDLPKFEGFSI
eukprot:jgi/Psemu1/318186/estExt_fgenesh1_pm.C_560001